MAQTARPRRERQTEKEGHEQGTWAGKKKGIQKRSEKNTKRIICPRKVVSHVFHWTHNDNHPVMIRKKSVTAEVVDACVSQKTCNVHMLRHI